MLSRNLSVCSLVSALAACSSSAPRSYRLELSAHDDTGAPLAGARFEVAGVASGETNEAGVFLAVVPGRAGDEVTIAHDCPAGHTSTRDSIVATLRDTKTIEGSTTALRIALACTRQHVETAVVVVVDGASSLPIVLDGAEIGRTGERGAAHLLFESVPGSPHQIVLDTGAHPQLMPQSPERSFVSSSGDPLVVFQQSFEERPKKRQPRPKSRRLPAIPYRIR